MPSQVSKMRPFIGLLTSPAKGTIDMDWIGMARVWWLLDPERTDHPLFPPTFPPLLVFNLGSQHQHHWTEDLVRVHSLLFVLKVSFWWLKDAPVSIVQGMKSKFEAKSQIYPQMCAMLPCTEELLSHETREKSAETKESCRPFIVVPSSTIPSQVLPEKKNPSRKKKIEPM